MILGGNDSILEWCEMIPGERAFIEPLHTKADLIVQNQRLGLLQISVLIERLLGSDSLGPDINA